jgi:NADPH:quinone reductase-like Zn-dependent oxidoreductase
MATMRAVETRGVVTTMKAIRMHSYGGPDVLVYEDAPKPGAEAGEALVRVIAAGVNPIDWKIRSGYAKGMIPIKFPWVPGVDISGVVEEVGGDVSNVKAGDEVYGFLGSPWGGGYAEYVAAKASVLAPKPKSLDFIQAAALPMVSLVAWQTLFDTARLSPGQAVLIHGASGGVGHMSVQLAKWKGARVIGTASARNAQFLKELGADETIDYHKTRFEDVARDADVVLDLIGGDTQKRSWKVLKKGGILISTVGVSSPEEADKYGVRAVSFLARPDGNELRQIAKLIDGGVLRQVVSTILPLRDAPKAHELSQTGHVRGKIVLKVSD